MEQQIAASFAATASSQPNDGSGGRSIRVRIASTAEERRRVYRFRYDVYVEEMGRNPPMADHASKQLHHELDDTATNFAAYDENKMVGVIRNNSAADSLFGLYADFYGIRELPIDHQVRTSITTGLMVAATHRKTIVGSQLATASYNYGLQRKVRWNFIDCIPPLGPFFERFGYIDHLPEAKHPEYPFSVRRLSLDLEDEEHLATIRSPFHRELLKYRSFTAAELHN
jgi:hypothetical protein